LHQCRLWVGRAREKDKEVAYYDAVISDLNTTIDELKAELTLEREKERESRAKLAETREQYGTQVARLQREVIDLKQKVDQNTLRATENERRLLAENARLTGELQNAISAGQELERDYRYLHQELNRLREDYRHVERRLRNPVARFINRIRILLGK
jgi:chromosome segregation ATPase